MKYNKFVTHTRKHAILFPMRQHFLSILTHYIEDIFVIYFLTTFFICNLNLSLPIYINKPCINIYILYYCCNYCKYFSIMLIIIYFYKRHYCFIFIFLVTYLFYMFSDLDKEINKSIQLKEAYLHQLRKNKQIKEEIFKQQTVCYCSNNKSQRKIFDSVYNYYNCACTVFKICKICSLKPVNQKIRHLFATLL